MLLDDIMETEKVEVRFFTQVIGADREPDTLFVNGLVLSNIEGLRYVKAKAFIDCTGDASLANMCGAPCVVWSPIMPPTLMALLEGMVWTQDDGGQPLDSQKRQKYIDQAISDGFFSQPDRHVPGIFRSSGSICALNAGKILDMDPLSCRSLSDSMVKGRRQVQEYLNFFRTYYPNCEHLRLVATAGILGLRTSRYIQGEYCLCGDDLKAKRKFPDQIAIRASNAIDIHPHNCSKQEFERYIQEFKGMEPMAPRDYMGLPYGILVPKSSQNLWVAGRCVSMDWQAGGAIRNQAFCSMMGQAAGVAAAQSIQTGQRACDLNTEILVCTLRKQDAVLPQETLSEEMTRGYIHACEL